MAETSFFWGGTTVGDATAAPYNAVEVSSALSNVLGSFVIPYTFDSGDGPGFELFVGISAVIGTVSVSPGAALVKGILYISDAYENITIASNASGNPRIDRIVLQRDTATQDVRLVATQGTPGATPTPPAVDLNNELPIAWVWVADGYDSGVDIIADAEIHDERVFKETGPSHTQSARKNMLKNAEYIGVTAPISAASFAKWVVNGAPSVSPNTNTYRGYRLGITSATNNEGIETTVTCNQDFTDNPLFTLYGYFTCTQGLVSVKIYRVNLSTGVSTLERIKYFRPLNTITEIYIRERITTEEDAIRIVVNTESAAANDTANVAELTLTHGYMPIVVYNHEIIWLDLPMTDAGWTSSAKSTGANTINLASSFGSVFVPYMRGVILRVRCRDSASAAAVAGSSTSLSFHHKNEATFPDYTGAIALVSCAGRANDTWEEQVVYVPLDHTDSNASFKVYVTASGAGTLDATIEVLGIIT
jgi:hypothetical protein